MKVYIHLLILALFSVLLIGCTWENKKINYSIDGSGSTTVISGSILLKDSINIAYVNQFSGSVMVGGVNVIKGTVIYENSVLTTGSGGEAEIIFADNSVVRLSQNSRLQISKKGTDNTTIDLQEGTLWARILKPFTDASFFTLETDDLSAGVRGTSVWLMTDSGGTDIGVVDTTSPVGQSSGALIEIVDKAYFGSGDIQLAQENILSVRRSKGVERKKMKLVEMIKQHPFIGKNTVQDIRYMNMLMQDPTLQMSTRGRVQMEMNVTMPTIDEVTLYLSDPMITSEIKNQGIQELNPKEFIQYLDIDEKIEKIIESDDKEADKKDAIDKIRKLIKNIETEPITLTETIKENIKSKTNTELPSKIIIPITVSGEKTITSNPPTSETVPVSTTISKTIISRPPTKETAPVISPTSESVPVSTTVSKTIPSSPPTSETVPVNTTVSKTIISSPPTTETAPVISPTSESVPVSTTIPKTIISSPPTTETAPVTPPASKTDSVPITKTF